jgi:hypothetical protein
MGRTTTNGEVPVDAQERAREGAEHLQAAARELIEAARAALDVAEEWVNDPEAVASLAGTLTSVGDLARRVTGAAAVPHDRHGPDAPSAPPRDDEPRVQRITVT